MTESMSQIFDWKMVQIKNDMQYKALLARIDEIFFATDENTPADDPRLLELDLLSSLVEQYEKEVFPIEIPSLGETLGSRLAETKMTQKELAARLGMTAPRLSAIINGKANPTFEQARTIVSFLDIEPAIVLA